MDIKVVKRDETVVFGMRHVGPYEQIGAVSQTLWQWVEAKGLVAQAKLGISLYYDDPTTVPAQQCRSDAAVLLAEPYPAETDQIKRIVIPAGTYVCYRHIGSYAKLMPVYELLYDQWIPEHGYQIIDSPAVEIYQNCPMDTPEDQLITDVCILVKDK